MPWTNNQISLFFSKSSPLDAKQKAKVDSELRDNPAMAHAKKGHEMNPLTGKKRKGKA